MFDVLRLLIVYIIFSIRADNVPYSKSRTYREVGYKLNIHHISIFR